MKLILLLFLIFIVQVCSYTRRPYTTPSPFGSYRFKLFKCELTERGRTEFYYPNFTCYAKAVSRDITTVNGYIMIRQDIVRGWATAYLEYKYGTIYRPVINVPKVEVCELLTNIINCKNPIHQIMCNFSVMMFPHLIHNCPYKAGEILDGYNITFPHEKLPQLFPQGDYRAKLLVYIDHPDAAAINATVIMSVVSPLKESFG